ncbi:MAG: glycosyltransferase [Thermoproteota archaeon]|uniref:Glycosyltransferase n=1 Tax=Ignisphaera aggregans TaxID=334771 RepID=A0A7J3I7F4_9CREN
MIAEIFAYTALAFGILFFTYAIRYYIALSILALTLFRTSPLNNKKGSNNRVYSGGEVTLRFKENSFNSNVRSNSSPPMISIHIPLYNEEKVVDRLMEALTSLDYPNYEVIVVDDSTDSTTEKLKKWSNHKKVKIVHRESRAGYKGGALNEALKHMDESAEYVVVFDADFIPPRDILWRFLESFENNKNRKGLEGWEKSSNLVAIQGYQWHVLNASENWITRTVSAEYAGNYLIERVYMENLPGVKMIAGSVFMIKAEILRKYGWRESLTEDWDLTLRLYRDGYKVAYTPFIASPAECPSTITALMRQRARWAEGHTYAVRKYFKEILRSKFLSLREKLEFLYLTPYYLNSFFFLVGTLCWLLAELLHAKIPFWTSILGWSLLFTNLIAIPLVNLTGLFLEYRASRHWTGALGFIPLMHILALPQAIASLRGLVEKKESAWFRTLKTGKITELNILYRLRKMLRKREKEVKKTSKKLWITFIIMPLILALTGLLQIGYFQSIIYDQNASLAVSASTTLMILIVLLFLKNRKSIENMKPLLLKTGAVITTTLLIVTLMVAAPIQASPTTSFRIQSVPLETLYFNKDGSTDPSNPGTLSIGTPSGNQPLDIGKTYWWASEKRYQFEEGDSGVWIFHLSGNCVPPNDYCTVRGEIYVIQNRNGGPSSGYKVGSYDLGTVQRDVSRDINIQVTFNKTVEEYCGSGCYILFSIELSGTAQKFQLDTGSEGPERRYTYLVIPENSFVIIIILIPILILRRRLVLKGGRILIIP